TDSIWSPLGTPPTSVFDQTVDSSPVPDVDHGQPSSPGACQRRAIQGSRQSERHQACEASSKCEIRHT
ncbi:unnamed protein product, partial [Ectocarpus sp. 13 AM-2016]